MLDPQANGLGDAKIHDAVPPPSVVGGDPGKFLPRAPDAPAAAPKAAVAKAPADKVADDDDIEDLAAETPSRKDTSLTTELNAIRRVCAILEPLAPGAQRRVQAYLRDRLDEQRRGANGAGYPEGSLMNAERRLRNSDEDA